MINTKLKKIGIENIIESKEDVAYEVNNKLNQETTYKPEVTDLESLADIIIKTNRTTVLEFGCGWSSLVFAASLSYNRSRTEISKGKYRRNNLFECHTVDSSEKYIQIAKARIPIRYIDSIEFYQSNVSMVNWNGRIATEYDILPLVNPDFIYIDAPSIFDVEGNINGWNTKHKDMMPMMCDILKIEHFLTPKTIIVVDGRAANARFIMSNLQRNWEYKYCQNRDQHFFVLEEEPLGKYSNQLIQDLYYKNDKWYINDL